MSQLTPILEAEIRIEKLHRQMALTTADSFRFLQIAREVAKSSQVSTWFLSKVFAGEPCKVLRRDLRRMERWGIVTAESNGSNNIYWSLKP